MKKNIYLLLCGALLFNACTKSEEPPEQVMGYAPLYQTDPQINEIKSMPPQPLIIGGKIHVKDHTLFQVELGKGIHVFDITHPAQPKKTAFIKIEGAQEIAMKGNLLYANNYNDLVVIDISQLQEIKELSRQKSMFHLVGSQVPPERGYFECVDSAKGIVIGWTKKMLNTPKCKY